MRGCTPGAWDGSPEPERLPRGARHVVLAGRRTDVAERVGALERHPVARPVTWPPMRTGVRTGLGQKHARLAVALARERHRTPERARIPFEHSRGGGGAAVRNPIPPAKGS